MAKMLPMKVQLKRERKKTKVAKSEARGFRGRDIGIATVAGLAGGAARHYTGFDDADTAIGAVSLTASFFMDNRDLEITGLVNLGRYFSNKGKEMAGGAMADAFSKGGK